MKEQRKYLALRAHIETLLQDGAQIVSRAPFTPMSSTLEIIHKYHIISAQISAWEKPF